MFRTMSEENDNNDDSKTSEHDPELEAYSCQKWADGYRVVKPRM